MSLTTQPHSGSSVAAPEARDRPLPPLTVKGSSSLATTISQSALSALEALVANKLRSFLTMLGIIIGVGAVIVVIAIGQGAKASVAQQLSRLGTNMVTIQPGSTQIGGFATGIGGRPTLTDSDVQAIERQVPDIVAISPVVSGVNQVVFNGQNWSTRVQGVYPDYQTIQDYSTTSGAFFTQADEADAAPVALLGQTVVQNLFPNMSPVGQRIRIRNVIFQVIGVLTPKGNNGFFNQDDIVLIPYSTAENRLYGRSTVNQIQVQVNHAQNIDTVINDITRVLRRNHHLASWQPNDFIVRNLQQILSAGQATANTIATLLTAVAAVSLLVGGIGIMNIMLVSVTERTREIGIRMAIGARAQDVLLQFLVEAVTLSVVGGVIGIVGGFGFIFVIAHFAQWQTLVVPASIVLAFGFAALIGIFFGYYPARTASRLDPIDALRHE
ncbi:MAG: ABC transporter permease [Chloroflexi bacterium]|nr:ABC transporter permease [Chloroflexota bacterium]